MAQGACRRAGEVRLVGLTHHHPGAEAAAVADVDLTVASGGSLALVGPEGAGKTTVLRLVAGLDRPVEGRVLLDGVDVAGLPAPRRPVAAVFGRYSLFPFLDVAANVALGLRGSGSLAGAPDPRGRALATLAGRAGTARRVREALELVRMGDYARRRPPQLAPAHQQRVAIARALVLRPRVLVLDEPLGALDDDDLRVRLAADLCALHRQLGITMIYATRSAGEASAVAERVAVLANGRLLLEAQPAEDAVARARADDDPAGDLPAGDVDAMLAAADDPGAGAPAA
ncbi:ATP-binding cassette domain-containing protein [Frankia sp. CNm7]|uniref:ATP-binding cassette domain-containing protein n=1 Tax=Frankia nepalensis TaxID=1836974 RepID=A0A937RI64_9ACTN|nr:ATP-binding cassette domain-containing protein [Frankia nepalensis]MBL7495523.1 ATP-binding cassette domain-containing protein [Frankia nepalensis]MBL7509804.1 ATP-binding cassette domain-containing protein [Frankia nepalensis]MBL7518617.1 ATP-binding cassette domain-containing protein [Frankia nepalensis]MBL7630627.1 ATP-binding cassette domain-containing protein [Frankia nepalensis]